jgi:hypothetical protein
MFWPKAPGYNAQTGRLSGIAITKEIKLSNRSRRKGARVELETVHELNRRGVPSHQAVGNVHRLSRSRRHSPWPHSTR